MFRQLLKPVIITYIYRSVDTSLIMSFFFLSFNLVGDDDPGVLIHVLHILDPKIVLYYVGIRRPATHTTYTTVFL